MTKEMYAANVKNWLMDLATGAKAAQKSIQYGAAEPHNIWKVTTRCYDTFDNGVAIHNLRELAECIDVPVKFSTFEDEDSYCAKVYKGYYYIELFGVRFYDYGDRRPDYEGE